MPLDAPISIAQQAKNLQVTLANWATQNGGVCEVVSNLKEYFAQSATNNDIPRILICYDGESARGEWRTRSALDRVDRTWKVAVIRGRGFSAVRGDSLNKTVGNAIPFYYAVECIRDLIRAILNISEEFPVEFTAIRPLGFGNQILDGYTIEFTTANDIAAIYIDQPAYPPVPDPNPPNENPEPEVPTNLAVEYDVGAANNEYSITWDVTRAPLFGYTIYFGDTEGGPYASTTIPSQGPGACQYSWDNFNSPLTPPSTVHSDMYLIIVFDDGNGNTAQTAEFHAVYNPS